MHIQQIRSHCEPKWFDRIHICVFGLINSFNNSHLTCIWHYIHCPCFISNSSTKQTEIVHWHLVAINQTQLLMLSWKRLNWNVATFFTWQNNNNTTGTESRCYKYEINHDYRFGDIIKYIDLRTMKKFVCICYL